MQTFELTILAPIPVGHEVEVRWYRIPVTGLLSGTKHQSFPSSPVVRDRQTGIIYGPMTLFWQRGPVVALEPDRPLPLQWDPLPGCEIEHQMVAKVVACRITSYSPSREGGNRIQTTLVLEPMQ